MMKLQINCLLATLLALLQLSTGYPRSFPAKEAIQNTPSLYEKPESTQSQPVQKATAVSCMVNSTNSKLGSTKSAKVQSQPATTALKHIVRKKRDSDVYVVDTPYDYHTTHLFCDFDARGRHRIIMYFPNHCIWSWNNKYVHEAFYYLFKLYQSEAFVFGQYNERLKQYETVPHIWQKS